MRRVTVPALLTVEFSSVFGYASGMLCTLLLVATMDDSAAQNAFQRGQQFYEQRAAEADSFRANPANINKAIDAFQTAIEQDINTPEAAAYLLQSYYFKAMYTGQSTDEQKRIYDTGFTKGEKFMERFPNSVPIKFWYGANIGRWADVHGFVQAATNGIAQKLRRVCKKIIDLDPQYQGGGGYRILAQVHFHSPNIPLVMGWPSDDRALELIEKAMDIAPDHPTNRMLYAEILLEFDRPEQAKEHLQYILDMELRPTHTVEDKYVKHRSRQMLNNQF
ncbi:MAG: tetratricopeptide repeat protein [Fodinibius sp.]|nr:tetratricopeptide repeat protein [Fodinibius sp.]